VTTRKLAQHHNPVNPSSPRPPSTMSSSRSRTVEDTYESQNDQRLDELHSKIRTLRGVGRTFKVGFEDANHATIKITTDIHDDVEAQNLLLDSTASCLFSAESGRR